MLRTKMMLLTVVVVALATPSLWAQAIQRPSPAPNGDPVCVPITPSTLPLGYLSSTNKCSSGYIQQNPPNSLNGFATTCADAGGVEVTYDQIMFVVGLPEANGWTNWSYTPSEPSAESNNPSIVTPARRPQLETTLRLTHSQGVFGFEVDAAARKTINVTFETSVGPITETATVGGFGTSGPRAERFAVVCSGPAIMSATIVCPDCVDVPHAIAQIRGDLFKGF